MTTTNVPLHRSAPGLRRQRGYGLRRRLVPTSVTQGLVWLVALVLVAGPIIPLIYTSFRSQPYYLPGGTWSLQPYRTLFEDPAFWHAVENTLVFAAATTVLAVGLGTLFAVLVNRTNLPGRRWLRILLVAPIVIPRSGSSWDGRRSTGRRAMSPRSWGRTWDCRRGTSRPSPGWPSSGAPSPSRSPF
ncbi:MAG: hypothetical protein WB765_11770 [Acidimicrobiales bacterium]